MGNCCGVQRELTKKRAKVLVQIGITYVDVALDSVNAYKLYRGGDEWWASCIVVMMFVPNHLTWMFLQANGMATLKEWPIAVFQLGPLVEFPKAWETGDFSPGMVWYTAAEGLGEAPMTTMLTAYILAFGGQRSWTFYVGVLWSFISIGKTATMLNFYGEAPTTKEWVVEFFQRVPEVALRITFFACFGYLMKAFSSDLDELDNNTQTALPLYLLMSVSANVGMMHMCEPRCSLVVSFFFAACMIFTSPMRFLDVFKRMSPPFKLMRYIEMFALAGITICPLDQNPRVADLLDNAPFLSCLLAGSVACVILVHVAVAVAVACCKLDPAQVDYRKLGDGNKDLQDRAMRVRDKLRVVADAQDVLTTGLIASLEGTNLTDPVFVFIVLSTFREEAKAALIDQGMPRKLEDALETGFASQVYLFYSDPGTEALKADWLHRRHFQACDIDVATLKEAGFDAKALKDAGFDARELKDAGFNAKALTDAGFDAMALTDVGLDARDLKDAGFDAKALKDAGFDASDLKDAGFTSKAIKDVGFELRDLKDAGLDLKDAGFTARALKDAGFNARDLRDAGFNTRDVKDVGFDARAILDAPFDIRDLKFAGFNARDLRDAGLDAGDLRLAGFDAKALKNVGLDARDLKDAGFYTRDLREAGFKARDLKDAGLNAEDLKYVGFRADILKDAGFDAKALKDAGFDARDLIYAGFDAKALKDAGLDVRDLTYAGLLSSDLNRNGLTDKALNDAGFNARDLKDAGFVDF